MAWSALELARQRAYHRLPWEGRSVANVLERLARGLARLPDRVLRAVQPTTGEYPIQAGGRYTDLDETEAERRRQQEVLRQGVDEDEEPKSS
jgi:hypothetical protein